MNKMRKESNVDLEEVAFIYEDWYLAQERREYSKTSMLPHDLKLP